MFSIFVSTKSENMFLKNVNIRKIRKMSKFDFFLLQILRFFKKTYFLIWSIFFWKIKIFKINLYFSFCLYYVLAVSNFQVREPVRKRFTVPPKKKTYSPPPKKKFFHQTSLFRHQLRDPLVQCSRTYMSVHPYGLFRRFSVLFFSLTYNFITRIHL